MALRLAGHPSESHESLFTMKAWAGRSLACGRPGSPNLRLSAAALPQPLPFVHRTWFLPAFASIGPHFRFNRALQSHCPLRPDRQGEGTAPKRQTSPIEAAFRIGRGRTGSAKAHPAPMSENPLNRRLINWRRPPT